MLTELSISALDERRLGDAADALRRGRPGIYFRTAKSLVGVGLSLRLVARRTGPREHELASFMYLADGLAFRFAWVYAGSRTHERFAWAARIATTLTARVRWRSSANSAEDAQRRPDRSQACSGSPNRSSIHGP
ncbi:MAG TPA: hypothetical protein VGH93_02880 [Solirubrobacteraceae bacterium]